MSPSSSRPPRRAPAACRPRTWFGYVSVFTCALSAAAANSLKALDVAKALQDFHLPPAITLGPSPAFYRAGQNQLLSSLFVGEALFKVAFLVNGTDAAGPLEESGFKMTCRHEAALASNRIASYGADRFGRGTPVLPAAVRVGALSALLRRPRAQSDISASRRHATSLERLKTRKQRSYTNAWRTGQVDLSASSLLVLWTGGVHQIADVRNATAPPGWTFWVDSNIRGHRRTSAEPAHPGRFENLRLHLSGVRHLGRRQRPAAILSSAL